MANTSKGVNTNINRSEVAAKLRHLADTENEWIDETNFKSVHASNAISQINTAIKCYCPDNYGDTLYALADLIEPKAKIMIDMNGCPGDDYRFCGSCKRTLSNGLFDDYEITHCPYCGCLLEEPY